MLNLLAGSGLRERPFRGGHVLGMNRIEDRLADHSLLVDLQQIGQSFGNRPPAQVRPESRSRRIVLRVLPPPLATPHCSGFDWRWRAEPRQGPVAVPAKQRCEQGSACGRAGAERYHEAEGTK